MLDTLPRLSLLRDEPARLLVPSPLGPSQRRSLELAGVATDRVVPFHGGHLQVDDMIFPSLPGRTGNPPSWALDWLRERLSPPPRRSGRRLYVSRGDVPRRRLVNEDALVEALRPLGFEVVFPGQLPLEEQLRTFAEAELVVAPHGGALVNLLASQEATLVEILDPRYVNGCYYSLTDALGLPYWYVLGVPAAGDDFRVSTHAVVKTLRAAGAA
jgi:capsular polysaccharide biosynthesis protein